MLDSETFERDRFKIHRAVVAIEILLMTSFSCLIDLASHDRPKKVLGLLHLRWWKTCTVDFVTLSLVEKFSWHKWPRLKFHFPVFVQRRSRKIKDFNEIDFIKIIRWNLWKKPSGPILCAFRLWQSGHCSCWPLTVSATDGTSRVVICARRGFLDRHNFFRSAGADLLRQETWSAS